MFTSTEFQHKRLNGYQKQIINFFRIRKIKRIAKLDCNSLAIFSCNDS